MGLLGAEVRPARALRLPFRPFSGLLAPLGRNPHCHGQRYLARLEPYGLGVLLSCKCRAFLFLAGTRGHDTHHMYTSSRPVDPSHFPCAQSLIRLLGCEMSYSRSHAINGWRMDNFERLKVSNLRAVVHDMIHLVLMCAGTSVTNGAVLITIRRRAHDLRHHNVTVGARVVGRGTRV